MVDAQPAEEAQDAAQGVVPGVQVSIELYDRGSGLVVTGTNVDQQVPCMSVVKLFIALDVIEQSPGGVPDPATAGQLQQMLRDSDDQIANRFWTLNGGPEIVTRTAERLGLTGTEPPSRSPGEWGDVLSTPQDLTTTYRYITDRLPPPGRDIILDSLNFAPRTSDSGFDQHFGIPVAVDDLPWYIKQGWGTSGSRTVMNSTGTVGPDSRYVVIVLATTSAGSYSSLREAVTAATRTLRPALDG